MKVSPARRVAFQILRRIEGEGAFSSALLAAADKELGERDRALCRELVLGVLRRRMWLDRALEHFADRKIERLDLPVVLSLRLGLYQLQFLSRIPASAAVNEAVGLMRGARVKSATAFVNAVLRRATREPDYDPAAGISDPLERLAISTSHPRWLIDRWATQFGMAEAAALAEANNRPAPLAFRFTAKAAGDTNAFIEQLRAGGVELDESTVVPGAWRVRPRASRDAAAGDASEAGARASRPGGGENQTAKLQKLSRDGFIYFQDEASQLVAHCLCVRPGERVLDVCAAPGSKSTLIARRAPQSSIVAGDLYEQRVQLIKTFTDMQAALNIRVIQYDATSQLPFVNGTFDRVLVDAPCSGTGTLRQNPEIRWRLTPSDISDMSGRQNLILKNAANMVRPGGGLVYSTCSVEPDENESVVAGFLKTTAEFEPIFPEVASQFAAERTAARTWPHRHDVDGFFVAAFRRTSSGN